MQNFQNNASIHDLSSLLCARQTGCPEPPIILLSTRKKKKILSQAEQLISGLRMRHS